MDDTLENGETSGKYVKITSCSKNLSSRVFSPGFVPAPSNKMRYS